MKVHNNLPFRCFSLDNKRIGTSKKKSDYVGVPHVIPRKCFLGEMESTKVILGILVFGLPFVSKYPALFLQYDLIHPNPFDMLDLGSYLS